MEFASSSINDGSRDSKLVKLIELFSNIPIPELLEALDINNLDFDQTVEHLLAAGFDEPNEAPSSSLPSSLVACHNSAFCPTSNWSRHLSFTSEERRLYGLSNCL